MKKNKGMIVLFLAPAVFFFLVIFVYPIFRTVLMTFFNIEGVTDSMNLWKHRETTLSVKKEKVRLEVVTEAKESGPTISLREESVTTE